MENINDAAKVKYYKEFSYLERNAFENNTKGIEIYKVVDKILEVINKKNPKSTYNVGFKAILVELFSKLPQCLTNFIIKTKLRSFK